MRARLGLTALLSAFLLPEAARAQILDINVMPQVIIHSASNSQGPTPLWYATRPHAYGFDVESGGAITRKIFLSWLVGPDYYPGTNTGYPHLAARRLSLDGGKTWGAENPYTATNAAAMSVIRRRNGEMLALSFRPPEGYFRSTDNAVTWTKYTNGMIRNTDGTQLHMLFHRGILEERRTTNPADPDVYDLYAVGYNVWNAYLVKSTDNGTNWVWVSTPADGGTDGDGRYYNEPTIERCADNSWLMVVRDDRWTSTSEMRARRTFNRGQTWTLTGPTLLPGLPTRPNTTRKRDCDPHLKLMPNGVLVLSYGPNRDNVSSTAGTSRNCNIAFSADGIGASWSHGEPTLVGLQYNPNPIGLESSGYTEAVPVSAHRFITIGDTGHTWSYTDDVMVTPNPYKIWGRYVDIVRSPLNRIDLKTLLAQNPSLVSTDLTYTTSAHPEARVSGAVDGSNDYWSGAFKSGTSGTYTIDLQRNRVIDGVAICMQYNTAQSATIAVATSAGGPWTNVVTHTNKIQNALVYTTTSPLPLTARYVRATVTAGAGHSMVCLNEIEVYSTEHSFENCGQNIVPHLFDPPVPLTPSKFWTTEGVTPLPSGYQSTRALYMIDTTTTDATISQTWTTNATKTLEFMLKPKAYAASGGAIQWRILSGSTIAFRLRSISSGQIQWYNGTTYTNVTGAFAPTDTWTRIKMVATATTGADTALLYLNGSPTPIGGTIGSENNVSSMNKLQFASGGGNANGDKALFDDVVMY